MNNFRKKISIVGGWLVGLSIISFIIRAIYKTISGEGLETFFTGFGVKYNYLGATVLILAIPVSIFIALGLRWWHKREERDFIKKYGSKDDENT